MKALSIRQPWAWAIICAGKNIENRTRRTNFRGTIAVHASAKPRREWEFPPCTLKPPPKDKWLLGAIIGFVDLIDCVEYHRSKWYEGIRSRLRKKLSPRESLRAISCSLWWRERRARHPDMEINCLLFVRLRPCFW
jgi:hypothetical protein